MARGINKVILVGHLGKDPEMRYTASGAAMANITLATTEAWKDKQTGEKQERTEWHRVVFWNRLAEVVGEYLKKGALIYVEGRLQTRKWQDQSGQDRYTTEVVGSEKMQMLGSKGDGGGSSGNSYDQSQPAQPQRQPSQQQAPQKTNPQQAEQPTGQQQGAYDDFDDDIPF